jgi:rhodanese-related sulfurtransferase|tara:strand:- start:8493 stop:8915 length:423 start_codon:yes stop_codon:yes gene_type:complete
MTKVVESEWNRVMEAYRKGNAMRLAELEEKRKRYHSVWDSRGDKKTCDEIQEIFKSGGFIVDVRNPIDYMSGGKIHNSVNVPIDGLIQWVKSHPSINKNTPILVYSNHGNAAGAAKQSLEENNYANVTNIGTHKWYNLCS